jgi:hypothetical protein
MGRYAHFITGFEYKFGFAIQPSEDIQKFGGYGIHTTWKWSAEKDAEECLDKLRTLEEHVLLPEVDFTKYEKTLDGTDKLYSDLTSNLESDNKIHYLYRLGAIIYHQLLYCSRLTVDYEL